MKQLIKKITPAIIGSNKLKVNLADGKQLVVSPHILVKDREGGEILKTMLDNGDCMDIPVKKITGVFVLPESFAIDANCLNFDYNKYELVFPKRGDWFDMRH